MVVVGWCLGSVSEKTITSSTQKTARARAIWPARRVWREGDWALEGLVNTGAGILRRWTQLGDYTAWEGDTQGVGSS